MQQHKMTHVLVRWIPVALGLAVLTGCVAVPAQRAVTGPGSPSPAIPVAVKAAAARAPDRILIMGASYTQGLGAEPATNGYAYLLGPKLGWTSEVRGIAGTGYLNPGPRHQGTFAEQIEGMPAGLNPSVLLIQGGRNDGGYPQAQIERAIDTTIRTAHRHFRNARIVLLGCIPPHASVDPGELRAEAALTHVAKRDNVALIDPIREHWITPANAERFAGTVPGHPNNAGYAYIAARVSTDLGPILHITLPTSASRGA
jgi:lysophospholipase L1-like esterase